MFFRMVYKSGQIFLPFCQGSRVWRTDRRTDRQTDRRTDGQTEFSSLYRVCITCSAVKNLDICSIQSVHLTVKLEIGKATSLCKLLVDGAVPVTQTAFPRCTATLRRYIRNENERGRLRSWTFDAASQLLEKIQRRLSDSSKSLYFG